MTSEKHTSQAKPRLGTIQRAVRNAAMALAASVTHLALADNPLVSHVYTADPAARVFNDRVYVVTSHDKDDATGYDLSDYFLFSSDDMVNWQDHGIIFDAARDTSWADQAYAPDMIERNGKYYLIFPNSGNSVGILEADRPEGPFVDHVGGPLITRSHPNSNVKWLFDPGAFVDDDGSVYIAFGGGDPGNSRVVKVGDDMRSLDGPAVTVDAPNFFEAPYIHKRGDLYYYSFSTNFSNGSPTIDYMTSTDPMRGYTYQGTVLPNPPDNMGNNNHASIVSYEGKDYIFYHSRMVSNHAYRRSICVDRLEYKADGTMRRATPTSASVAKVRNFDPYRRVEAETMDTHSGIETEPAIEGTLNVMFDRDDWVRVSNVEFDSGASFFKARVAASSSTSLDIFLDDVSGSPVATIQVPATGGLQSWQTVDTAVSGLSGLHNVYIRGNGRVNLNWYEFESEPQDCGDAEGAPVCCDMSADDDRNGWGEQWGERCRVTDDTENVAPLNPSDVAAAINVGGSGEYFEGVYYRPDTFSSGGEFNSTTESVQDAGDSKLFNTERYGDFQYNIPLDNGAYTVSLHFNEMYWSANGSRVFDVSLEGRAVSSGLDIFQEAGQNVAFTQQFDVDVSNGALNISLSAVEDNATLSGILVQSAESVSSSSSSSTSSSSSSVSSSSSSSSSSNGGAATGGSVSPSLLVLLLMFFMPVGWRALKH